MGDWHDGEYFEPPERLDYEQPVWTTREGECILIKDMKESHLFNSIKVMRRNGKEGHPLYSELINELVVRSLIDKD